MKLRELVQHRYLSAVFREALKELNQDRQESFLRFPVNLVLQIATLCWASSRLLQRWQFWTLAVLRHLPRISSVCSKKPILIIIVRARLRFSPSSPLQQLIPVIINKNSAMCYILHTSPIKPACRRKCTRVESRGSHRVLRV